VRLTVLPRDDHEHLTEPRPPILEQLTSVDHQPLLPRVERLTEHSRSEVDHCEAVASPRRQLP
jgi:hypothetical protein